MANLSDDLIFEIIVRLPLKSAIRCSLLNRTFNNRISHPSFVLRTALLSSSRTSNTIIFRCSSYYPNIFTRIIPESTPLSLATAVSILASCNGVLFVRFSYFHKYYVFNPITGGIMLVDYFLDRHNDIGLAVDLAAPNYRFKLVTMDIKPGPIYQSVLSFSIIVPYTSVVGPSTLVKSWVDFVCETFTLMPDENIRSVYAYGCLHWLGDDGKKIVVFDVEKEQARIINGPVCKNNGPGFHSGVDKWFGFAEGSLRFIYTLQEEIVIHSHDYLKDEWQVKYKIANICNPSNNDYRNGLPLFFDGGKLFLQLRKKGEDGEVRMYDIFSDKWETVGKVEGWSDCKQLFFSYFPTLAKVSDKYLLHMNKSSRCKYSLTMIKNSFRGLQGLLRYP